MQDLEDKVAFITGGASGIGLAMAKAFGRQGMKVVLADIESDALETAVAELTASQIKAHGVRTDVAHRDSVRAAALEAIAAFGKVHVVCNNAGVAVGGLIGSFPERDWDWITDVNLMGVVHGVEVFTPLIESHGEGGHFVNTASIAGMVSPPFLEPYSATKFAVVAMSEGWAAQLAPRNIGVSILCPGFVKTRINESRRNRPATYGHDVREAPPEGAPVSGVLTGIDPGPVGERVVEAVKDGDLYVFTHPEFKSAVSARFDRILAAFDKPSAALASLPSREVPAFLAGGPPEN
jgi:NAD(P)-dependent dehydrogenase (short-subunit alcohol dehydrogenase family)